jgi:hypothetical protein
MLEGKLQMRRREDAGVIESGQAPTVIAANIWGADSNELSPLGTSGDYLLNDDT